MTNPANSFAFEVVSAGTGEPAVSLLMPVRNQRAFVGAAIAAALAQQDVIAELLVADDASDDGTAAEIERALRDHRGSRHRIRWRRNPRRLGLDQLAPMVAAASAPICVAAHGDDVSYPWRARRLVELFEKTGADLVASNVDELDPDGSSTLRPIDQPAGFVSAETMVGAGWVPPMLGAALAWRTRVYADFPTLNSRYLVFGYDWLVPFRAAVGRGAYYTPEPLLQYRRHEGQWSVQLYLHPSTAVARENFLFRQLAVSRAMRRDLEHLVAGSDVRAARARELLPVVERGWPRIVDELVDQREALLREGKRPCWMEEADFADLQRYRFRLRFLNRGRWRRLRAWWRTHFAR